MYIYVCMYVHIYSVYIVVAEELIPYFEHIHTGLTLHCIVTL